MKETVQWNQSRLLSLLLISGCLVVGCGRTGRPTLVKVVGTVTKNKLPVPGVLVKFSPSNGRPSVGYTEMSGKFELNYLKDVKGAVRGTHMVCIEVPPDAPARNSNANAAPGEPELFDWPEQLDVKDGSNEFHFDISRLKK